MPRVLSVIALVALPAPMALAADIAVEHVRVYHEKGRFGGWPANHGIWAWGDEILVGFSAGYHKDLGPERHNIDHDKPEEHLLARSRDGFGLALTQGRSITGNGTVEEFLYAALKFRNVLTLC